MEETYLLKHPGVKKKILAGGRGPLPCFSRGTKLVFHFQTLLDNFERTVIDDSRKNRHPTEIFVGKMFKMEVWEVLLTSMRLGEVAEFWCDATHTGLYPIVSKGMRLAAQGKDPLEGQKHTCGMGNVFTYHSTGFPELDKLMMEPQPLIFIMELISVGDPFSYVRESWLMEKDEKMQAVPSLHLRGNALVQQGRYADAAEMYREAVLLLRTVQSREMPGDEDYVNLSKLIIPLVLNYCQCKLELEEYYEVIEHTSELIDKHKDCVKAYYKRAKAYAAVWSEKEARRDFLKVADLDATLARLVQKELKHLSERMKEKYWEEKERYWNMLKEKTTGKEEAKEEIEGPGEGQRGEEEEPKKNFQCPQQELDGPPAGEKGQNKGLQMPAVTEGKERQQMLRIMMLLQDEGIFCIKEQHFAEATLKFKEALEYVDYLQSKEMDDTGEDWESLEKVRLPLALNLSQCRLELGQFHEVIELNNKILSVHKDNVKAMYQRARAHAALCDEDKARGDFSRAAHLNAALRPIVKQELRKLGERIRAEHVRKKNYWSSSQERQEQEAKTKTANRTAMERGVKPAAESQASGGGGEAAAVVVAAQAEEEGAGTGEERSLRLPGHRQSQNSKESSLDEKWMSPLAPKEKRAEMGHELVGREGDSARSFRSGQRQQGQAGLSCNSLGRERSAKMSLSHGTPETRRASKAPSSGGTGTDGEGRGRDIKIIGLDSGRVMGKSADVTVKGEEN